MHVSLTPDFGSPPPVLAPLLEEAGRQSFFSTAAWYDVFARTALPAGASPLVYLDDPAAPALAMVCQVDGGRTLSSLANFYSVEHGLLRRPGSDLGTAAERLVGAILGERPAWERVVVSGLETDDPVYPALMRAFRARATLVEPFLDSGTWYEATAGTSFAQYLERRPSQLRNTWRRKLKSTTRDVQLGKAFFDGPERIEDAVRDYEIVYAASWKQREGFPEFSPALIRMAAAQGALRLGIYYVGGEPAAAQYWIVWNGRAVIYKLAYDERFEPLSLGTLLTMEMAERVLEADRPDEITFGRGDDPYKKLWLSQRRERWSFQVANPRTLGGLAFGARRAAAMAYHRLRGQRTPPDGG